MIDYFKEIEEDLKEIQNISVIKYRKIKENESMLKAKENKIDSLSEELKIVKQALEDEKLLKIEEIKKREETITKKKDEIKVKEHDLRQKDLKMKEIRKEFEKKELKNSKKDNVLLLAITGTLCFSVLLYKLIDTLKK